MPTKTTATSRFSISKEALKGAPHLLTLPASLKVGAQAAMVVAGIATGLLGAELGLRAAGALQGIDYRLYSFDLTGPAGRLPDRMFRADPVCHHLLAAGFEGVA